jgi:hypothetical protein
MMAGARLAFRLQRFEILAAFAATALMTGLALVITWRLGAVDLDPGCWPATFGDDASDPDLVARCAAAISAFLAVNEGEASRVMVVMAYLPTAIGLALGIPLIAREIEQGTAPTVWALAASRSRWLSGRLLPVLVILLVFLAALATSSELLWMSRSPTGIPNRFDDAGAHGLAVVAKGLAAFGIAAVVGAVMGRTLPTVIVAGSLSLAMLVAGGLVRGIWEGDLAGGDALVRNPKVLSSAWLFDSVEPILFALIGIGTLILCYRVVGGRRIR